MSNGNKSKPPVNEPGDRVADIYNGLVNEIYENMMSANHQHSVDLEVSFRSACIDKKGFILWNKKIKENVLEIRLATRISPGERETT